MNQASLLFVTSVTDPSSLCLAREQMMPTRWENAACSGKMSPAQRRTPPHSVLCLSQPLVNITSRLQPLHSAKD